jgi:hypothetical protein
MIATVKEVMEMLDRNYANALDENLVITWWDSTDFEEMTEDAIQICDDALEVCVGHVNDTVWQNAKMKEEGE